MKKFLSYFLLLGVCLFWTSLAQAGTIVSGATSGCWNLDGSPYVVEGESWIPAEGELAVDAGVVIELACPPAFRIQGCFEAQGTSQAPIIVQVSCDSSEGFYFEGTASCTVKLRYVDFQGEYLPIRALTSFGRNLRVEACDISAQKVAIACTSAAVQLISSRIRVVSDRAYAGIVLYSAANSLMNCNTVEVNSPSDVNEPTGVYIHDTPDLEIDSSDIRVSASRHAKGIWSEGDCLHLTVSRSVVEAKTSSNTHWACGILVDPGAYQPCDIINCTIRVSSNSGHQSVVRLCAGCQAEIHNSILWLDGAGRGEFVLRPLYGAGYEMSYCDLWRTSRPSFGVGGGFSNGTSEHMDDGGDEGDATNFSLDPMFVGEESRSLFDYHLKSGSPCIDAGDSAWGRDPDDTPPDVGAFYLSHNYIPPVIEPQLPLDIRVGPAFPNPFNSSTTMPLELRRSAVVEMFVFDILGREEAHISLGILPPGRHLLPLSGNSWASGVHWASVIVGKRVLAPQKLVLVK